MSNPEHILMVDGSGYIFRAFYALPPMTRPDGTPINAVYGFCNMMMKMLSNGLEADGVVVFFDAARKNFRNDIYADYKANRKDTPEELVPQFPLIRDAARAFNLTTIEMEGYEADDLIATYAHHAADQGSKVTIISADKDLMQLIDHDRGKGIFMFDPMKAKMIGLEEVEKKFGVGPDKVVDIQALAGDASDNVPGVPGIGVKTAAQLIVEYGSLEELLERASEIKQNKRRENLIEFAESARISKQLVQLYLDAPMSENIESFIYAPPTPEQLLGFADEQNFRTLRPRLEKWLKSNGDGADASVKAVSDVSKVGASGGDVGADDEKATKVRISPPMPKDIDYQLVLNIDELKKWIADAEKVGIVAIDTETDSLDAQNANMVGFSLSVDPSKACYVPLRHVVKTEAKSAASQGAFDFGMDADETGGDAEGEIVTGLHSDQIDPKEAMALLKPMLEDKGILKVGQNIKYDIHVLKRELGGDVEIYPIDDTMVMSYVLDGSQNGHGMDELAELHLGVETIKFKDVCGTGKTKISFAEVELEKASDYAAEDADITLRLHQFFSKRLVHESMKTVYEKLDRPLVYTLTMMEEEGVNVDLKALDIVAEKCASRMDELAVEIHKLAGEEFNIASPMQLGQILFDKLGLEGGKKNKKTGAWSTSADVLDKLAGEGHYLPAKVLDWRMLAKLKSTYADALAKQINKRTNRVHTNFAQSVTSTGRLASNNPNLQNIPIRTEEGREIRKAFRAVKGCKLIAADYSQVELRLAAHMADIKGLKKAFSNGMDIHAATASQVFGVPVEGMDPMVRRRAKEINFGIIYGISPFGLAKRLDIPRHEAKEYIDAYLEKYSEIVEYMEKTKEFAHTHGYVETPFGRKCYVPGIHDTNGMRRSFAERSAINAPIQGGAADIMKIAMNRIYRLIKNGELDAKMLMQVHDELVFEVKEENVDKAKEIIKREMENAADLSVPLIADVGVGDHWGEAH
ncbi:MAG: DNA polymerase I [Alphaproteobacteria bacterium]|nr:DNA polymerase I [Alphaproteobacteria bacterium]